MAEEMRQRIAQIIHLVFEFTHIFISKEEAEQIASLFPQYVPIEVEMLTFTQEQIVGLIPAQAIIDYDRAKEVLEKVCQAQINKLTGGKTIYREKE